MYYDELDHTTEDYYTQAEFRYDYMREEEILKRTEAEHERNNI